MKRREKLIEVMEAKDIEMDEELNGSKDRRRATLANDIIDG